MCQPSPLECAVSLTIITAYKHSEAQSCKKIKIPTAHHGDRKTTKFTMTIIALGNIRAKCSPKDLQEVKQFPQQVGEITNSMMSLKTNCGFESPAKTTHSLKPLSIYGFHSINIATNYLLCNNVS